MHFFTQSSSSSFRNTCPYQRSLFYCNTCVMSSVPNLSLSSLLGNLSFRLMSHIHLTILISARWSARHTHTHTRLMALCPGLPRWAVTRKVKPIWILLEQEIVSSSGISWAICKSAPRARQISKPAPHYSVFYRPDALPATQPTVSKYRQTSMIYNNYQ